MQAFGYGRMQPGGNQVAVCSVGRLHVGQYYGGTCLKKKIYIYIYHVIDEIDYRIGSCKRCIHLIFSFIGQSLVITNDRVTLLALYNFRV